MSQPFPETPFFQGNFAPVGFEADAPDLPVRGDWPGDLTGTLYRNGPNPAFAPKGRHHWFNGQGMIHAFAIADGRVSYRNRWVATPRYQAERAAGEALFGAGANRDPRAAGVPASGGNTNIVWHAGRLMALEENAPPFELDPSTLAPVGFNTFAGAINDCFTAHPKFDPDTGEMIAFGYSIGGPLSARVGYYVLDETGAATTVAAFDAPYCSMVHDFIVTRNFVIFPILPLTGSLERAARGGSAFAWDPAAGSHLGVLRRGAALSTLRWFKGPPSYVFHPMNAWDDGERIFADVMRYPRAPLFPDADGTDHDPRGASATLWRWEIDTAANTDVYTETQLDDLGGEFPRFDERFSGKEYRFGYFAFNDRPWNTPPATFNGIAALDLAQGRRQAWHCPAGDQVGEPVFVPRSPDAPEGDGHVLAVIYRAESRTSDLLCFNAQEIAAGPVGMAHLSTRVPFGFHGNFVSA